uniref:Putative phosphatidylinositol 3-phosphate 3-phosphatase myotubularin mtm1 n=1 Tax=Triatoma infestans TaxID=30076 RepID=A0A023EZJ3_TRIIF
MEEITVGEIQELLQHFSRNTFKARDCDAVCQRVMQKCIELVSFDYSYVVISNSNGELSAHYPSQLIVMEYERAGRNVSSGSGAVQTTTASPNTPVAGSTITSCGNGSASGMSSNEEEQLPTSNEAPTSTLPNPAIYESVYDIARLKELFSKARFARCRARFPLPVILYKGKNICRSATLSGGPEIYGRSGLDYLFCGEDTCEQLDSMPTRIGQCDSSIHGDEGQQHQQGDWQLFDRVRSQDIRLLHTLNVGAIIDFMVEKKKVKFGVNVTSSEKVDKENRYSEFTIISLPYPGCEFFKKYRDNDYVAKGLVFDWSQGHVDANIGIPDDNIASQLKIDWQNYKMWDLVKLTQNYMQLVLKYVVEGRLGLLIHCISGWDRTPLFVSLLRLSLWADGAIHQTLSPQQILYFTIAYDWMLFGHNLQDRLSKGEDIFFFCFYFLKHMVGEEFSISRWTSKTRGNSVLRTDSDSQLEGLLLDADAPMSSQGSNVSLNSSWSSISSKSQDTPPVYFHSDDHSCGNGLTGNGSCCDGTGGSSVIHVLPTPVENGVVLLENNVNNMSWSGGGVPQAGYSHLVQVTSASSPNSTYSNANRAHTSRTSPVAVPSRASSLRHRNESTSSLSTGSWQFISGTGSLRGSGSNSTCGSHISSNNSRTPLSENQFLGESTTTIIEDDCFIYNSNITDAVLMRRERLRNVRALFYNCYCSTVGFKLKDGSEASGLGHILGNFAEKVGIISGQRTSL